MTPRAFMEAVERRIAKDREAQFASTPAPNFPDARTYGERDAREQDAVERAAEYAERMKSVMRLRAQGLTQPEVGERLNLTARQVRIAERQAKRNAT